MTAHIHHLALNDKPGVIRMKRIDLGVFGTLQVIEIVTLNGLVQERQAEGDDEQNNNSRLSRHQARKIGSTAAAFANSSSRSVALSGVRLDAISSAMSNKRPSPGGIAAVMSCPSVKRT